MISWMSILRPSRLFSTAFCPLTKKLRRFTGSASTCFGKFLRCRRPCDHVRVNIVRVPARRGAGGLLKHGAATPVFHNLTRQLTPTALRRGRLTNVVFLTTSDAGYVGRRPHGRGTPRKYLQIDEGHPV